jgi:CDP-diacylglycerol--glycerol-3-phosphate 3-phosphatidyltransferase
LKTCFGVGRSLISAEGWAVTQLANLVTAIRVVLTPVFVAALCLHSRASGGGVLAVLIFAVIAASDVFDGRIARRWGTESSAGRTFDHFADICFLLAALSTYAVLGTVPWWVPAAVGGSFGAYVVDSWARNGSGAAGLIGSRIGHAAGVLNYTLVGILVCNNTAGIGLLSAGVLWKLFWLVPIYSALAVIARLAGRTSP